MPGDLIRSLVAGLLLPLSILAAWSTDSVAVEGILIGIDVVILIPLAALPLWRSSTEQHVASNFLSSRVVLPGFVGISVGMLALGFDDSTTRWACVLLAIVFAYLIVAARSDVPWQASSFGLDTAAGLCMLIATVVVSGSWLLACAAGAYVVTVAAAIRGRGGATRTHIARSELAPLGVAALAAFAVSTLGLTSADVTSNLQLADWLVVGVGVVVYLVLNVFPDLVRSQERLVRYAYLLAPATVGLGLGLAVGETGPVFAGSCTSLVLIVGDTAAILSRFETALEDARG